MTNRPTTPRQTPMHPIDARQSSFPRSAKNREALTTACQLYVRSLERTWIPAPARCPRHSKLTVPPAPENQHKGKTPLRPPKQPCLRDSCLVVQQTLQSSATTNGSPHKRSSRPHAGERLKSSGNPVAGVSMKHWKRTKVAPSSPAAAVNPCSPGPISPTAQTCGT
jgi:hypothetical protein